MGYISKPLPGCFVDWTHPLSRGLVGCWLFNEHAGQAFADLAAFQSCYGILGSPLYRGGPDGCVLDVSDGLSRFLVNRKGGPATTDSPITILAKARTSVAASKALISWGEVTDTNYTFTFGVAVGGTSGIGFDGDTGITSTLTYPLNAWTVLGVAQRGIADRTFFADGRLQVDNSHHAYESKACPGGLSIASSFSNSSERTEYRWTGQISWIYVWGRALTDTEMMDVFHAPYANILSPSYRRYFIPAAGGGLSIPVAMASYRQRWR